MIRLDDLSPEEVEMFNVYKRLIPLLTKQGYTNPKTISKMLEIFHKHKLSKGRVYFNPKSLKRREYALIRPLETAQELFSNPKAEFKFVKSSNLLTVSFLNIKKILEIEFTSGWRYRFYRVAKRTFTNLINAPSKGKYFHRNIRDRYSYRRVA